MSTPTRQFANDDDAAQHWLTLLRDGAADQKITAREQLAAVFERRGMYEEAADLLASNVRDGVRNADIFRWLARLYRAQGDEVTAMQAAAEAAKYLPHQPQRVTEPTLVMEPVTASTIGQPAAIAAGRRSTSTVEGCFKVILILLAVGAGGVLLLIVVGRMLGSVSGSTSQRGSVPTTVPRGPQTARTESGDGNVKTRPFALDAGSYTVEWTADRGSYGGNFIVNLRPADGRSGSELIANTIIERGESYQQRTTQMYRVPAGQYYLDVTAPGSWVVYIKPL